MAAAAKDTIYIDVDDEITSIVDKVSSAQHHIVALVLPKRAAVLQSIVNMKLLKRTSDAHKKKVVLITSEAGLLPLAGAVGLYVAKNLQSKPGIPAGPSISDKVETIDDDEAEDGSAESEETPLDPTKSVGALAGISDKDDDVIEVDNDDIAEAGAAAGAIKGGKKAKKNKKLSVPNFNKFRVRLILAGVGVVALIVFWILATFVLPKSHVIVRTDTSDITTSLAFTASPAAKVLDETKLILPAEKKEIKKDSSQKVPATGQKDIGTKATGTMTVYNCSNADIVLPAGTLFTSNGLSYATNQSVSVPASDFNKGVCKKSPNSDVGVTAAASGDKYNAASASYASNYSSGVTGTGSAMTGGTSNIIKVVSQSDIDSAKQKIVEQGNSGAADELKAALKTDGYFALAETQSASDPAVNTSAKAGEQASDVTVTATTTYSMLGVKENDLKKIIDNDAKKQIDSSKQVVLNEGLDTATLQVGDKKGDDTKINLQTTVTAGPELSVDTVRQLVTGKKKGDAIAALEARPGVKGADVSFSPFWVNKSPKKTSKISVTFEKSSGKTD